MILLAVVRRCLYADRSFALAAILRMMSTAIPGQYGTWDTCLAGEGLGRHPRAQWARR